MLSRVPSLRGSLSSELKSWGPGTPFCRVQPLPSPPGGPASSSLPPGSPLQHSTCQGMRHCPKAIKGPHGTGPDSSLGHTSSSMSNTAKKNLRASKKTSCSLPSEQVAVWQPAPPSASPGVLGMEGEADTPGPVS